MMENYDVLNDFLTLADMSRDLVERMAIVRMWKSVLAVIVYCGIRLKKGTDGVYRREKSQETFELSLRMEGKWETEVWLPCAKKCTG